MAVSLLSDSYYLLEALLQAEQRQGFCAPNPAVGAVLVKDHHIVSRGIHWQAGGPHAEVEAFRAVGEQVTAEHTLYVTLEPCSHHGKTPPCTEAIIRSGVGRVVYAHQDTNPVVAGRTQKKLEQAGILCDHISLPEIAAFYSAYDYWQKTQCTWFCAKLALTPEGVYAKANGDSLNITGQACRDFTHQKRLQSDAIFTTVQTVLQDDPQMNVRLLGNAVAKPVFVLDPHLEMPVQAKLWLTTASLTLLHAPEASAERMALLTEKGAHCLPVSCEQGRLNWREIARYVGSQGYYATWVEAGGRLFLSLWRSEFMREAYVYVGSSVADTGLYLPREFSHQMLSETPWVWSTQGEDWVGHTFLGV